MSITDTARTSGPYATDGVQTEFPFTFKIFDEADVRVVLTEDGVEVEAVLGSAYTVALNADQNASPGGVVEFLVAPDGPSVSIASAIPYTQPAHFTNTGGFYPEVLNDSLDRVTALVQQLRDRMGRVPEAPLDPSSFAGMFPVLNPDGSFSFTLGVGAGGDITLRADLAGLGGADLIGVAGGGSLQDYLDALVSTPVGGDGVVKVSSYAGGTWTWAADDSTPVLAAQAAINGNAQPGGVIEFDVRRARVNTPITVGADTTIDFKGCWVKMAPSGPAAFSVGWGDAAYTLQVAQPKFLNGSRIYLEGANKTFLRAENTSELQVVGLALDLRNNGQIGYHIRARQNYAAPYYGLMDNFRITGNATPGGGQKGILFEGLPVQGSYGINRWLISNARHIAALDIGFDCQAADGLVGSSMNFEACYDYGIRFGYNSRSFTGSVTTGGAAGGFTDTKLIGSTLDQSATIQITSGANAGYSCRIRYYDPLTGQVVLPYSLPHNFSVADAYTITECKARACQFSDLTYEGSGYDEVWVDFTAGSSGCRAETRFATMPTGYFFKRAVEDDTNTIAAYVEDIIFEATLTSGSGDQWLDVGHIASTAGGATVTRGGGWVDSVSVSGGYRPGYTGNVEFEVYYNGVLQPVPKPKLTMVSPHFAHRVLKELPHDAAGVALVGQALKVKAVKDTLEINQPVWVKVRVAYLGGN